jgi:hypothetical protein
MLTYLILAGALAVPAYVWLAFARTPKGQR